MKRKKLIILIIFIALLPLAFMSGKSSWIILDETESQIGNTYYPVAVDELYEATYDGKYQEIIPIDCSSETEKFDQSKVSISYYDGTASSIGNERANKPINAGIYYAKTFYNNKLIGTTKMTIKPYPIYIVPNACTISYGDMPKNDGYKIAVLDNNSYVEKALFTNEETKKQDSLPIPIVSMLMQVAMKLV